MLEEDEIIIEDIELWLQKEQDARLSLNLEMNAPHCNNTADVNSYQDYYNTHTNIPSCHGIGSSSTANTASLEKEHEEIGRKRPAPVGATTTHSTTAAVVATEENTYKVKGQSQRGRKKTPNYSEEERVQLKDTYLRILAGQLDRTSAVEALAQSMQRSVKAIEVRFYLLQQEGVGKGVTAASIPAAAPLTVSTAADKGDRADSPVVTSTVTASPALLTKKSSYKKAPISRSVKTAAVVAPPPVCATTTTIEPIESGLDIDDVDTDALLSADWGLFDDLPIFLPGEVVVSSNGEQREGIYGIVRFPGFHDPPGF